MLNSFGILEGLIQEISPELGIPIPTREALLSNFHGSLRDTFDNVFRSYITEPEIDMFEQHFLARQDSHYDNVEEHLLSDAVDLSNRIAQNGIRQILITNRDHKERGQASPRSIIERSLLGSHIQHIICGDDSEFRKPDVRVAEGLLHNLGAVSNEMVVIGDQYVDAQFALNLGCSAIIANRGGANFAHESLSHPNWQQHVTVVKSLDDVQLAISTNRDI